MIKFYSQSKTRPLIDAKDMEGCSPPAVFVGKYGYPKVDIGPLLPPVSVTPQSWTPGDVGPNPSTT